MFRKIAVLVEPVLAAMTFIEWLDELLRVLSGIAALVVAVFAVRAYIIKIKLDKVKYAIEQRRLKELTDEKDKPVG